MKDSKLLLAFFFSCACVLAVDRHYHDGDDLDMRRIAAEPIEWRDDVEPGRKYAAGKNEPLKVKFPGFRGLWSSVRGEPFDFACMGTEASSHLSIQHSNDDTIPKFGDATDNVLKITGFKVK